MAIDPLYIMLLIEGLLLCLVLLALLFWRWRRLRLSVQRFLQRRQEFADMLAQEESACQDQADARRKQFAEDYDLSDEGSERLLQHHRALLVAAQDDLDSHHGEHGEFWARIEAADKASLAPLLRELETSQAGEAEMATTEAPPEDDDSSPHEDLDAPQDVAETPADDDTDDAASEARAMKTELEELRRIERYQARKIDELQHFGRRYAEMQDNFHNVRASNERLRKQIYDLMWDEHGEPRKQGDAERITELEGLMSEFERSNQEMALCIQTLEQENARLHEAGENVDEGRDSFVAAVARDADEDSEVLSQRLHEREAALEQVSNERDELRAEVKSLQAEYVRMYAQQGKQE